MTTHRNPFFGGAPGFVSGIRIMTSELVGEPYEDWSGVRSHGRAARRRKKHPQRIVTRYRANGKLMHDKIRNVIYCHPDDARRIEAQFRSVGS